ncbi:hypothetical protein Pcinc_032442 [Petrolisthes cinctipes]|uniref:Uncharacterized protein n=1 Tax=Petrolisthes cinctipes TaxID=88211 RepID=A0AAE1EUB5_PETCI|nr:hypothetical protein Pcinc_032442 [Petrolisthes cinctipes]
MNRSRGGKHRKSEHPAVINCEAGKRWRVLVVRSEEEEEVGEEEKEEEKVGEEKFGRWKRARVTGWQQGQEIRLEGMGRKGRRQAGRMDGIERRVRRVDMGRAGDVGRPYESLWVVFAQVYPKGPSPPTPPLSSPFYFP